MQKAGKTAQRARLYKLKGCQRRFGQPLQPMRQAILRAGNVEHLRDAMLDGEAGEGLIDPLGLLGGRGVSA